MVFTIKLFEEKKMFLNWTFIQKCHIWSDRFMCEISEMILILNQFSYTMLIHPNIHLYTTFTIKLSIWLQYLSAFFSSISVNATIYVMVHIRFRFRFHFHFHFYMARKHSYSYIYKHHTLQYFHSSSALETNKPITNTALNSNNCMVRIGNHTIVDDDLCTWRKFPTLSPSKEKNGRCETNNMYPILFYWAHV